MEGANEYLAGYCPRFNTAFGVEAAERGAAFVPLPEAKVRVHEYEDGSLAVFHEQLRPGRY